MKLIHQPTYSLRNMWPLTQARNQKHLLLVSNFYQYFVRPFKVDIEHFQGYKGLSLFVLPLTTNFY